jgi:hypothetical protein
MKLDFGKIPFSIPSALSFDASSSATGVPAFFLGTKNFEKASAARFLRFSSSSSFFFCASSRLRFSSSFCST